MAKVSTFELLVKRIGPPNGIVPDPLNPINAPFRKLLQGYYLTVSNLSDRLVNLRLQATFPILNATSPFAAADRELVSTPPNHFYAYDRTGAAGGPPAEPREILSSLTVFDNKSDARVFQTGTFQLEACQTGLLNIIPNPSVIQQIDPQIEIRGYIDLVQVDQLVITQVSSNPLIFIIGFETPPPAELMVTPETRGTFIDDRFDGTSAILLDFDQSNYALPTFSGGADLTVPESVNPFIFTVPTPFTGPDSASLGRVIGDLTDISAKRKEKPKMISELIESEELKFRRDLLGRYYLDDESIKLLSGKSTGFNLSTSELTKAIQELEYQVNNFAISKEKKG